MFRATSAPWLASVRNGLSHGVLLQDDDEFSRLARGFVGCNVIIDLVDLFLRILAGDDGPILGDLTVAHLKGWLSGDDAPPGDIDPGAALAFNDDPLETNPWRRVNVWLALAAIFRRGGHPPASTAAHARALFTLILADGPFPPRHCRRRAPQVLDAFDRWWDGFVAVLADWLGPDRWDELAGRAWMDPDELAAHVGRDLADGFGPEHVRALADLLRWKQWQVERCTAQLNSALPPFPVAWSWVEDVVSRLWNAHNSGRPFRYNRGDRRALRSLLEWAEGTGLAARHGVARGRFAPLLEGWRARPVAGADLRAHLADWGRLLRAARLRQLPPDWGDHRPVEDLFAHPLPNQLVFARWEAKASRYGLGRDATEDADDLA